MKLVWMDNVKIHAEFHMGHAVMKHNVKQFHTDLSASVLLVGLEILILSVSNVCIFFI